MNTQPIRLLTRIAAVAALALGLVVGAAATASAQLPEEFDPITDELAPITDGLAPILDELPEELDPILDPITGGDDAPEDDDPFAGDGDFESPPPAPEASPTATTLPQTGGIAAVGLASLLAAGGLALRRFLRL